MKEIFGYCEMTEVAGLTTKEAKDDQAKWTWWPGCSWVLPGLVGSEERLRGEGLQGYKASQTLTQCLREQRLIEEHRLVIGEPEVGYRAERQAGTPAAQIMRQRAGDMEQGLSRVWSGWV